jgi:hypothetical protein
MTSAAESCTCKCQCDIKITINTLYICLIATGLRPLMMPSLPLMHDAPAPPCLTRPPPPPPPPRSPVPVPPSPPSPPPPATPQPTRITGLPAGIILTFNPKRPADKKVQVLTAQLSSNVQWPQDGSQVTLVVKLDKAGAARCSPFRPVVAKRTRRAAITCTALRVTKVTVVTAKVSYGKTVVSVRITVRP